MKWFQRRNELRSLLKSDSCFFPASIYDVLSARMAEMAGFECTLLAGSVVSMSLLGAPDIGLITLDDVVEQVRRVARTSNLPMIVDADDGHGNALNVIRTVQELDAAGASAVLLEDSILPAGHGKAGSLVSREEAKAKMSAAIAARHDSGLIIIGRTDAYASRGLDETILRLNDFADAGVDAVFPFGIETDAELQQISSATSVPLMLIAKAKIGDKDQLASRRVRIALQGHQPLFVAVEAARQALFSLRNGVSPDALEGLPRSEFLEELLRSRDFARLRETHLPFA